MLTKPAITVAIATATNPRGLAIRAVLKARMAVAAAINQAASRKASNVEIAVIMKVIAGFPFLIASKKAVINGNIGINTLVIKLVSTA